MSESRPSKSRARRPKTSTDRSPATRLTQKVGLMAGRLAQFLDHALPEEKGVLNDIRGFLNARFDAVSEGRPISAWAGEPLDHRPRGSLHPLDRLADGFSKLTEENLKENPGLLHEAADKFSAAQGLVVE